MLSVHFFQEQIQSMSSMFIHLLESKLLCQSGVISLFGYKREALFKW